MLSEQEALQILISAGAIITSSHIVYTSGKHGSAYVNKDAVYPHTCRTSELCRAIAERVVDEGVYVDTVVAPAVGGVILSQWIAYHLTLLTGCEVMGVYAEKEKMSIPDPENLGRKCYYETGEFVIQRGYDRFVRGKNVLVGEDILNTGGSAKKVVEAVRRIGGDVVAVAALCNRGGVLKEDIGDPPYLYTLANVKLDAWDEADCPLCISNIPINIDVGKGREFLAPEQ